MSKKVFERREIKYILTVQQMHKLMNVMRAYMEKDEYPRSTIKNIYYDTDNFQLIRKSIEKPKYKEKLRIRSYGDTTQTSPVFVEIKKKFLSVVYKRRVQLQEYQIEDYLTGKTDHDNQITKEIKYFQQFYQGIKPQCFLSYDRLAFHGITNPEFRITFDQNVIYRFTDLDLKSPVYGDRVLDEDKVILEVKTLLGLPQWLLDFFNEEGIYKSSFSKYGKAYQQGKLLKEREGLEYA